ncbi:unnamed protein product [Ectocarpus fasciculatus]
MWTGPFANMYCTRHGFECEDSDTALSIDGDTCLDMLQFGGFFDGVEVTVPCKGDDDGSLLLDYCFTWKTEGDDSDCEDIGDIVASPNTACSCDQRKYIDIKVCPAQTDLEVTWTISNPVCLGDGVDVQIDISGIPTDAGFKYVIEDENEDYVQGGFLSMPRTIVVPELKPDIGYTIDVTTSFPDFICKTLSVDLEPICSCNNNDEKCDCISESASDCPSSELICCPQRNVCDLPPSTGEDGGTACGDPHMTGFLGQKFDFTGEDGGWYSIIADSNMNVNMRVTSPVADLPEITYITGLSVLTTDAEGFDHSIVIEVAHPHSLDSCCPAGVWPCLADGALRVFLDGDEALFAPGTVSLGPHVGISAANLPGACRSFGFEKYWERKKLEYASHGRRLGSELSMGEWILGDPTATNMDECLEYVAQAEVEEGGVFAHQSEHASFQIVTPEATIRLSHGRLHQIAMRDPTDQFDLPDHLTWQMNMAVDHNDVSRAAKGVLGETFVSTRDASGRPIMAGIEAIRGKEEDYRVEGPLGMDFVQGVHAS